VKPFGLQTVLDYRKRLEDSAQHKLIEAKTVYRKIEEKYILEQQRLTETLAERDRREQEGINIMELIRYEEHTERLTANIEAISKTLQEKALLVKQAQEHLLKRAREKQVLEKLKEKQNHDWRNYLDKKEALMLDEIAIIRHEREDNER